MWACWWVKARGGKTSAPQKNCEAYKGPAISMGLQLAAATASAATAASAAIKAVVAAAATQDEDDDNDEPATAAAKTISVEHIHVLQFRRCASA